MMRDKENGAKINGDTIDTYVADRTYNTQEEHDNLLRKYQQLLDKALRFIGFKDLDSGKIVEGMHSVVKMIDGAAILSLQLNVINQNIAIISFSYAGSNDSEALSVQFDPSTSSPTVVSTAKFIDGMYQKQGHIQVCNGTEKNVAEINLLFDYPGSWYSQQDRLTTSVGI